MILARVVEPVVSTIKHEELQARAVFVMQPVDEKGSDVGATFLAVDNVQAGPGDTVIVLREGSGIRQVLGRSQSPLRCLIVGVVDAVTRDVEARK
ncbi:MAG TPA: hypothetical protein DCQ06_05860 [Myxococcales bacterium]|nr:hypothetical protein [Myxococcales bacterium]HAN31106.1 hypothetical protein [Myxococcales bacterium]|tara:strand:+ start:156 stop:440 length:285 start_codon:yes stop_codon:yes gene_type:complete